MRTVPVTDDRLIIGPTTAAFMFCGRKLRLPRNLGPYSKDMECMATLTDAETIPQSPVAQTHDDLDEDLTEETLESLEALREPWESRRHFHHHTLVHSH